MINFACRLHDHKLESAKPKQMNQLSGQQAKQLCDTLIQAYDHNSLAQMVRFELNEHLDSIAEGGAFADRVFNLITWAERTGRLRELLEGAKTDHQNPQLQALIDSLLNENAPNPASASSPQPPQTPVAIDWCHVPAGPFYMGSTPQQIELLVKSTSDESLQDLFKSEGRQHLRHVDEFFISRTPITNAQFAKFASATGYITTAEKKESERTWQHPNGPNSTAKMDHAVVCVSWHDAIAFCKWAGVQLPSEAQWEKAARGDDGRIYPWGDEEPNNERCNFNMNVKTTTPVGKYPDGASPYGCLDMAGNVWEWTSSLYKPYPYDVNDGREALDVDGARTLRGGSFSNNGPFVRCANRDGSVPEDGWSFGGFRVVVVESPGF